MPLMSVFVQICSPMFTDYAAVNHDNNQKVCALSGDADRRRCTASLAWINIGNGRLSIVGSATVHPYTMPHTHTHTYTKIHRDKLTAVLAPPYYVVSADNNNNKC